jgi:hypothetical protein
MQAEYPTFSFYFNVEMRLEIKTVKNHGMSPKLRCKLSPTQELPTAYLPDNSISDTLRVWHFSSLAKSKSQSAVNETLTAGMCLFARSWASRRGL